MTNANDQFDENMTLDEVEGKIEQLNKLRVKIIQREVDKKKVIEHIKVQMITYGITNEDLKNIETIKSEEEKTKPEIYELVEIIRSGFQLKCSNEKIILIPHQDLLKASHLGAQIIPGHSGQVTTERFLCIITNEINAGMKEIIIKVDPNLLVQFVGTLDRKLILTTEHQFNNFNYTFQKSLPPFGFTQPHWRK